MKVRFLKLKNWLLVSLMSALGLSSCHCHRQLAEPEEQGASAVKEREEMKLMYGVPTMNYMIRGQVKDADGKPVKDVRVNMLEHGMEISDGELQGDPERVKVWLDATSVATDKDGRFVLTNNGRPREQVRLLVRDVDGNANGSFRNRLLEVDVSPTDVDRTNAGGWNQGTFNKDLQIQLESK